MHTKPPVIVPLGGSFEITGLSNRKLQYNGCTVEVWEWITNFIPHFITSVITYPGRD